MGLRLDPVLVLDGVKDFIMGSLSGVNCSIGLQAQSKLGERIESACLL